MDSTECLNFNQIYRYVTKKSAPEEAAIVEKEILNCKNCADEVEMVKALHQAGKNKVSDRAEGYKTVQPKEFFAYEEKFFRNELTEAEEEKFFSALLNSPEYFNGFKDLFHVMERPGAINKEKKTFLNKIESADVEDRLTAYEKIFAHPPARKPAAVEKNKEPFHFLGFALNPTALLAVALCSILALFSYLGYQKHFINETLQAASSAYYEPVRKLRFTLDDFRLTNMSSDAFVNFRLTRSVADSNSATHNYENVEKALKLRPNDPKLNHQMGVIKYLSGDSEAAEMFLKKAIGLDENFSPAYNDLSLIKVEQGKHKEALELLKKAIEKSPEFLEAQFNKAIIYEQLNENAKAIDAWKDYLRKETNEGVIKAVKFRIKELENS